MKGINDEYDDESIDQYGWELRNILGPSENGDGKDDNERQDKERNVNKIDDPGYGLVHPKEPVFLHELVLNCVSSMPPVEKVNVEYKDDYQN